MVILEILYYRRPSEVYKTTVIDNPMHSLHLQRETSPSSSRISSKLSEARYLLTESSFPRSLGGCERLFAKSIASVETMSNTYSLPFD